MFHGSFFYNFFLVYKTSCSHSFRVGCLATNSLSFPSFKNIIISPLFLNNIFTGCKVMGWRFFSFSIWKMLCHFLLYHFWWEIHFFSNCFPSLGKMFFCLLSRFFHYIQFLKTWLWRVLVCISLGLYCLKFAYLLESVGLHILPNLRFFFQPGTFFDCTIFLLFSQILATLMFCYSPIHP